MHHQQFDFDTPVRRRGTGSYKWDTPADSQTIPLWVADMDFKAAPPIIEALRRRVDHGVFGYTLVGDDYYKAVCDWFATRHGFTIDPSWIIYTSGVVPAISAIIKAVTKPGEKVIVQTPAYNCFFSSIRNDECRLASNPLLLQSDNSYTIDFDGLEKLAADPEATVLLLCNPHNPSGRCWTREELIRVGDIALRHGLFVISDEIHCELVYGEHIYTPFASLSPELVRISATCISPSKAFNIAGLQIANIVTPNPEIRARIDKAINVNEVCDVNPFGVVATIAAYNESLPWLEALLDYLQGNYQFLSRKLSDSGTACRLTPLEATYLAWLDIRSTGLTSVEFTERFLREQNVMLNPGTLYGAEGEGFVRINLATTRALLTDVTGRLLAFIGELG